MKQIINQLIEMVKEAKEDAEEGVRDCEGRDEDIYQGWVEALDFVQTSIDGLLLDETENDPLKVSEETQSALNKIADSYLRANYPSSSSGLFAYAEINDIEGGYNEETDEEYDVYEVFIVYGIQEEGYKEEYCEKILVRTDNLEEVTS
mgnify:CR=1 FL=1